MNKELLDIAIRNLIVHDVYLHSCDINVQDDFFPEFNSDPLLIQFRNNIKSSKILELNDHKEFKSAVIYRYEAAFRAIPKNLDDKIMSNEELLTKEVIAEVIATFSATYFHNGEDVIDEEIITEFGLSNVGFHVWPYWREYASSVANRLRLPHFIVPLKRVKDIQEEKK